MPSIWGNGNLLSEGNSAYQTPPDSLRLSEEVGDGSAPALEAEASELEALEHDRISSSCRQVLFE